MDQIKPADIEKSDLASRSANTPSATYCALSVEETCTKLHTSVTDGLESVQDANYRRSVHGLNELVSEEEENMVLKFISQFYEDPLILLLIGSALVSFFMGNLDDAISITLAITIVITVGFVQEYRSEKSLEALNRLVPPEANLTRAKENHSILASNLVPGDLVHFSVGDRIPADVRIIEAIHLEIDESNLTGENKAVFKTTEPCDISSYPPGAAISLNDRKCIAYMGTLVRGGHGSGIVVGTAQDTAFGSVFELMSDIEKPKTPLQVSMDKLGKELSIVSFAVIGVICLIGVIQGRSWLDMFTIAVSLAVAAIPEGLPIIVTVTLALGVLRMANQKAIMRKLPSVETLGSVNVICSDKTGTLTRNHMTVTKVWTMDMGDSNSDAIRVRSESGAIVSGLPSYLTKDMSLGKLFEAGNICNNARSAATPGEDTCAHHGNPTDIALIEVLDKFGLEDIRNTCTRVHETPFSSSRKWMAVASHSGDKSASVIHIKGAMERIYPLCTSYVNKEGKTVSLDDAHRAVVEKVSKEMSQEGLRIIAVANGKGADTTDPNNLTFIGLIGMHDPPRPGVQSSIRRLMSGGVRVIMITGDNDVTALAIAKQIGIPLLAGERSVMTGDVLDSLSPQGLEDALSYISVFARTSPEHKMTIVRALQARGDVVAMTGDGVNDAPALKLADIGIAMGKHGTDVAKEAADMVLTDDDFSTILAAIEEGKGIFYNIQNFITFQLSTSIAALSLVAIATCFGLPNPLNAMQILWINILMDGPPAQSLGVEPVDHAVMNKPPRSRNDHVLTRAVIERVLKSAAVVVAGTMVIYVSEMTDNNITARDTTMTFTCFVLFDMFNALACRSATKSVFESGWFSNKMFNVAVSASLLGQLAVIYIPFFQKIFQTEALSFFDLVTLTLLTSTVWIFDEVRKFWKRKSEMNFGYSTQV
ncbi:calcium-transporting P [Nadsonia fulvescens var. elongata DSM 6958]|uniref:Calcium-transporting ATPase n=1 Tax=Nadsonia fulvescens var. elongata DSM 6958 TaxID=857566 RepID=A0A1E3PN65_9ASCO|nr:calcium-transporting P [Nadsonia fulvescens var. elongata DSM 6958]